MRRSRPQCIYANFNVSIPNDVRTTNSLGRPVSVESVSFPTRTWNVKIANLHHIVEGIGSIHTDLLLWVLGRLYVIISHNKLSRCHDLQHELK